MTKPNALAGKVDGFKSGVLFIDDTLACNYILVQANGRMAKGRGTTAIGRLSRAIRRNI